MAEHKKIRTFCRICHANCSLIGEMKDGRPVKFYGDKDNPISHGFTCIKGRNVASYHEPSNRLTGSLKRTSAGLQRISSADAVREISDQLRSIVSKFGERSVALFLGTFGYLNLSSLFFSRFFMEALGSKMYFTSYMLDQPGKLIGLARHGAWLAGTPRYLSDIDVMLLVGHNPLISMSGAFGFGPAHNLLEAKRRGLKLVVVDPRNSETAQKSDLYLQARPGSDSQILASLIHIIIKEQLYDKEFVQQEALGLDALETAVRSFTPEAVSGIAGVEANDLVEAARLLASTRKGLVMCGTGPNMSGNGNLAEYLGYVIMTLAGYWPREGDTVRNPGVLFHPRGPEIAATSGPTQAWGFGEQLRVHNLTDTAAGLPTAALSDEILTPGEGKIRALIVVGGNPMLSFPDQAKAFEALNSLDLLVCIDPVISATGKLSHYIIAPKLSLELPAVTSYFDYVGTWGLAWGYDVPYMQFTPPILPVPEGSDLIEEWEFFIGLAREMGLEMKFAPISYTNPDDASSHTRVLDLGKNYSSDEMLAMLHEGSPIPLEEVKRSALEGHVFDIPPRFVQPKPKGWTGKFNIADEIFLSELSALADTYSEHDSFPFLLISRRLRDHYNSTWHGIEKLKRTYKYNPAFMNPADMHDLDLRDGDVVEITSETGKILGIVEAAPEVRSGCISMAHGWGTNPDEIEEPYEHGSSTGRLISTSRDCDPHTWMARQSAIPVQVQKAIRFNNRYKRDGDLRPNRG